MRLSEWITIEQSFGSNRLEVPGWMMANGGEYYRLTNRVIDIHDKVHWVVSDVEDLDDFLVEAHEIIGRLYMLLRSLDAID